MTGPELQLNEFERKVVSHILESSPPGKHAARSALRHLERAWRLVEEMPELAIFCGLTAEEEAATAVFHALKQRNYAGAEILSVRRHLHKTALHPFLVAVGKLFTDVKNRYDPKLEFNNQVLPAGLERLLLKLTVIDEAGGKKWAYPLPPLEFTVKVDEALHTFMPELAQLASEKGAASAFAYVKNLSNRRNQVLYAAPGGIPHVEPTPESFLIYRKSAVFCHLIAFLLIEPYSEQQSFVQQGLNAFLEMIRRMPSDPD